MEEKEKSLLAQVPEEKGRSLLAQVYASDQNRTEKMANYSKILEENVTDLEACHKCGEAEKELIDAVDEALEAHEEAEGAAEVHSELAETHALAVDALDKADQEFTTTVSQLCPVELPFDAEESAFDSLVAAAEDLKKKAMKAQALKALEEANKTLVDQAKASYDDAAAAAEEADKPIADLTAAEEVACANVLPPEPTPVPTKPKYIVNTRGETSCPTDYTFILDEDTCNKASEDKFGKTDVEVVKWSGGFKGCHLYNYAGWPTTAVFNTGNLVWEPTTDTSNRAYMCVKEDEYTTPDLPKFLFNRWGMLSCPTDYTFILDKTTCTEASEFLSLRKNVETVQWGAGFRGCHVNNKGNPHISVFNAGNLDGEVKTSPATKAYLCVKQDVKQQRPVTGTFIANSGKEYKKQVPFKLSSTEFVFGFWEGNWFKMAKVDLFGNVRETRHTRGVMNINKLTVPIWNAANRGGGYTVKDFDYPAWD